MRSLTSEPDYTEIAYALDCVRDMLPTLARGFAEHDTLTDEQIAEIDDEAGVIRNMLRTLAGENLTGAVAAAGGDITDPGDLYVLRDRSIACRLAFYLHELAAAMEGWGIYDIRPPYEAARAQYLAYAELKGQPALYPGEAELAVDRLGAKLTQARAAAYVARVEKMEAEKAVEAQHAGLREADKLRTAQVQERQQRLYNLLHAIKFTDSDMGQRLDLRRIMRVVAQFGAMGDLEAIYPPRSKEDDEDFPISSKASKQRRTLREDIAAIRGYLASGRFPWDKEEMSELLA